MDASRIRKKKFAFSQISGYVWTMPKRLGNCGGFTSDFIMVATLSGCATFLGGSVLSSSKLDICSRFSLLHSMSFEFNTLSSSKIANRKCK